MKETTAMKTKTVYVVGAGFSVEAHAPTQDKIVKEIFSIHEKNPNFFDDKKIKAFKEFLNITLNIQEEYHETIPLEDIFTPLDSCLTNNLSFRNLPINELKSKRDLIFELIEKTMHYILQHESFSYLDQFANYLIKESSKRKNYNYRNVDPVSVISTNWDILLDNSIYNQLKLLDELAVVDYCCHVNSYDKYDETIKPGLEVLGKGGFSVKLLKLHGSINWLQCPRCQRIYVNFNNRNLLMHAMSNHPSCPHCNSNFGFHLSHELTSNLIMPTFLKDLSNPQFKIIWQNAGIELSEAKKIIFIGYSLPQADFEMKQLLARMVDKETEIEIVNLRKPNNPNAYDNLIRKFEQFFGRKVTHYDCGTSKYIEKLVEGKLK